MIQQPELDIQTHEAVDGVELFPLKDVARATLSVDQVHRRMRQLGPDYPRQSNPLWTKDLLELSEGIVGDTYAAFARRLSFAIIWRWVIPFLPDADCSRAVLSLSKSSA